MVTQNINMPTMDRYSDSSAGASLFLLDLEVSTWLGSNGVLMEKDLDIDPYTSGDVLDVRLLEELDGAGLSVPSYATS